MGPDPLNSHPVDGQPRVGFLKPLVDDPQIEIGEFTYYDDPDGPEHFVERCVLYKFPFVGDRLVIGRFCALATGVRFIMNGANHAMDGFSTFPFNIFGGGWEEGFDPASWERSARGDTRIGHDVWIGRDAVVLPGVTIGNGAIIAAHAVVAADVPPYAVVAGNPAGVTRRRFGEDEIRRLESIAWWDWPREAIARNVDLIRGSDLDRLEAAAETVG